MRPSGYIGVGIALQLLGGVMVASDATSYDGAGGAFWIGLLIAVLGGWLLLVGVIATAVAVGIRTARVEGQTSAPTQTDLERPASQKHRSEPPPSPAPLRDRILVVLGESNHFTDKAIASEVGAPTDTVVDELMELQRENVVGHNQATGLWYRTTPT